MRRTVVSYEVIGSNHRDLLGLAEERYRQYMDDPEARLPSSANMESRPYNLNSDGTVLGWVGEVTVALTNA